MILAEACSGKYEWPDVAMTGVVIIGIALILFVMFKYM